MRRNAWRKGREQDERDADDRDEGAVPVHGEQAIVVASGSPQEKKPRSSVSTSSSFSERRTQIRLRISVELHSEELSRLHEGLFGERPFNEITGPDRSGFVVRLLGRDCNENEILSAVIEHVG